jgi:hypothetical protein
MVNIVVPSLNMTPVVTRLSYSQGVKHATFLKHIEAMDRNLLPYTLEAFNVGGFYDLDTHERTDVLRLVEGSISRLRIKDAMDRFKKGSRPPVVQPTEERIVDILDTDGVKLTEVRSSDNFINATFILNRAGKRYKSYVTAKKNRDFQLSFVCAASKRIVERPLHTQLGVIWMHHRAALHLWEWCELDDGLDVCLTHLPDNTTDCDPHVFTAFDPAMMTIEVSLCPIYDDMGTKITDRRSNDNYVDGTLLLASLGIKWDQYHVLQSTTSAMESIAYELDLDVSSLVHSMRCQRRSNTWIHPEVAIKCVAHYTKQDEDDIRARMFHDMPTDAIETYTPATSAQTSKTVSITRSSDGYMNATFLRNSHAQEVADEYCSITGFMTSTDGRALKSEVEASGQPVVKYSNGLFGGTWIAPGMATAYAKRCGHILATSEKIVSPFYELRFPVESGIIVTNVRRSNNYVDATKMCRTTPRQVKLEDFLRKNCTKSLITDLITQLGLGEEELVVRNEDERKDNGKKVVDKSGVWMHPQMAVSLGTWCDPEVATPIKAWLNEVGGSALVVNNVIDNDTQLPCDSTTSTTVEVAGSFLKSLHGDDGEMITEMRASDGYVNATKMCTSAGKEWSQFFRNDDTKAFLEVLSSKLHIHRIDLVQSTRGHTGKTMIHPRVAIKLAAWCSPAFEVQVTDLVLRYTQGLVTTEESNEVAKAIEEQQIIMISDRIVTRAESRLAPIDVWSVDSLEPCDFFRDIGVPALTRAPSVVYLLCVGKRGSRLYFKFGLSDEFKRRSSNHDGTFVHNHVVFTVVCTVGTAHLSEDTMKRVTRYGKVWFDVKGSAQTECFWCDEQNAHEYVKDILETVKYQNAEHVISTISSGREMIMYDPVQNVEIAHSTLDIEKERTIQIHAQAEAARYVAEQETQRAVVEQETKRIELQIKLLELELLARGT